MAHEEVEIVVNACYGGFGLTPEALDAYRARCVPPLSDENDIPRHDPVLVGVVKEMGTSAFDRHAQLELRRIPAQYTNFYRIHEYDGNESIEILYDKYKVHAAKALLRSAHLTLRERIARAAAVLGAPLG